MVQNQIIMHLQGKYRDLYRLEFNVVLYPGRFTIQCFVCRPGDLVKAVIRARSLQTIELFFNWRRTRFTVSRRFGERLWGTMLSRIYLYPGVSPLFKRLHFKLVRGAFRSVRCRPTLREMGFPQLKNTELTPPETHICFDPRRHGRHYKIGFLSNGKFIFGAPWLNWMGIGEGNTRLLFSYRITFWFPRFDERHQQIKCVHKTDTLNRE